MKKNQIENQNEKNLIIQNEKNLCLRLFKEQIDLINELPEGEREKVLYIAVVSAFQNIEQNEKKSSLNHFENQNENAYISVSVSVSYYLNLLSNSLHSISKSVLNLLKKTLEVKEFSSNYGGKRKNSGRKTTKKESEQITPKKDKFCNEYIDLIKKEYKKVFGKAGMLTADNLNKISELAENNPDFMDTIPETIKKLKRVEFDGLRYNAKTLCWLFDEDHYEKVYSGAWDFETREEVVERLRQKELEERRKKQNELANSNGFG